MREQFKETLAKRIAQAVKSYDGFVGEVPPADVKGFAAHHAACRAALAHVDMLVKLARWAEGKGTMTDSEAEDLDRLLAGTRSAVSDLDDDS
ncbi:MAG: hypothetical protein FD149_2777 [Rhodospirillaceae bacterium]|nr:MAG: hypothetical protein FD149_2777 [Rhodospirillaceae bacterium]